MFEYPEYDSPFRLITEQIATDVAEQIDDMCYKALKKVAVDVDKETLLSALRQDSERYREAYRKGYETGYTKREDEIVRCRDCKYWWYDNYCEKHCTGQSDQGWFCADGELAEKNVTI